MSWLSAAKCKILALKFHHIEAQELIIFSGMCVPIICLIIWLSTCRHFFPAKPKQKLKDRVCWRLHNRLQHRIRKQAWIHDMLEAKKPAYCSLAHSDLDFSSPQLLHVISRSLCRWILRREANLALIFPIPSLFEMFRIFLKLSWKVL